MTYVDVCGILYTNKGAKMKEDNSGNVLGYWFDVGSLFCGCSNCGCKNDKEYDTCPNCNAIMKLYSNKNRKE